MKIFTRVYFSIFFICFFGTIDVAFSQSATAPIITKQPVGGTFAKNATLQLYVQSQSLDNGFQTYQWYKDGQAVVGADNSILTTLTPGAAGSYSYYCEITNTVNSTTVMVQSNTVIVKVINKEYPDHLLNGDMEHWSYPGGIQFKNNPDVIVPGVGSNRWAAAVSAGYSDATIGNGWFTTYCGYYTGSNLSPNIPVAQAKKGGVFEIQASTTGYYTGGSEAVNGEIVMELVLSGAACSYQHIATQVGKIYEWSLHHAARKDSGPLTYNRIAVVIGKSINQQTDYTGTDGSQWKDEDYPYGQNIEGGTSLTNFFQLITLKLANSIGLGSNVDAIPVGDYTVTYNSSVYYVRIIETALNSGWHQYKGVYSIPEGQGTTVFGFASITPSSGSAGNGLDNVVFASGSGLSLSPSMAYSGESSLSVTTKPGYVYGLVEVRGSSVSLLPGIDVLFSGVAAPVYSAGQEWYFPNAAGTLTFANLTPGKTYRMVGIPSGAVSVERGTNLDPGKVLDEGYYSEVCAPASNPGSDAEMGLVTGSVYLSGSVCKSRLSVLNTHSDVEYALVETDGSEVIGWRLGLGVGLNSSLLFEDLSPDHDYVLVSRPYGYNEINYLSSLSSGVEVRTPTCTGVKDVSPDKLTLSPDGTTLTLSESDSRAKYDVYDPQTGLFVGAMQQGNDNSGDLSFTGLTPGQTYHITMRESGVSDAIFSVGVRIYPRSADLSIDYTGETVRNETSGTFPLGIEYRLGTGTSTGWVLGDDNTWRVAVDAAPLSLGIPLHNVPTPVLDSLKTLAVASGTLHYRIQPGQDGWTGPSYSPEKTLEIPRRPSAPLRDTHYALNYRAEQLEILGSHNILYSVNSGQAWSGIQTSASPAPFYPDLNWVEVSKNIALRFPPTVNTFASDTTLQQIKGRGPEPRGVLAVINQTDVTIEQLLPETDYQYSLEVPLSWTPYTTGVGETQLPSLTYDASYDYLLRYAATDDSPASFYQMLSAPLMVLPVNFGEYAFGLIIPGLGIVVKNTDGAAQDILALDIQDGNAASLFTLSPTLDNSNRGVPGAASSTQLGENTNFTITPQAALPAGHYQTSVRVQYNRGGNLRWSTANVYLTVIEAQWGETLAARISGATSSSLTVTVEGVPNGASALLRLADGTPVPGIPNVANNTSSYTFTGLSPASAYTVYYHLAGDANHSPTPEKTILGWTAYAPEDAVRVDYTTEMLLMRGGYSAADYDVTINGNPVTTIPHQVSSEAETGFTVSVVRKDPAGIIPSSEPHTFNVIGREQAPGLSDITLVSASNQSTNDGSITFTGSSTGFQYRLSGYSDIMSGWSAASGSTGSILRMDSYEVRYPSTTDKFASKYRTLDMDNVPAFTITPLSVCAGGSITLSAAIGNLGADVDLHYYTGGDGSGELGSLSVTPPVTTTYFVQGVSSITGFKSNMKTLVVTVNPLPSLTLSSTNERICAGGSLDLSTLVSLPGS
ncbi:hypothetical protein FACS1894203_4330 [Bacteroidia bacterium]|nr:hypothetical protein FACS1894203_4330 [Bacteroidia bacterium]